MGTISDKLTKLQNTKAAIKASIIRKGQAVSELDSFESYPAKIDAIETGIDTSDATATAADIATGMTAYARGKKITGSMGAASFNRKYTAMETTIDSRGAVSFGNYPDLSTAADSFSMCVAEVYDSNGSNIQSMLILESKGVSNNQALFQGSYINSSLGIVILQNSSTLASYSSPNILWTLDPDCALTNRKVKLHLFES